MKGKGVADKWIYLICLGISVGLYIGGFFCPPMGVIDGSVLKASGILFGFASLAVVAQAIHNGKYITFSKGDTEIEVGVEEDNDDKKAI